LILKTFLAHKLTAVNQTKLKKNCVISSKTPEVMKVLVFAYAYLIVLPNIFSRCFIDVEIFTNQVGGHL